MQSYVLSARRQAVVRPHIRHAERQAPSAITSASLWSTFMLFNHFSTKPYRRRSSSRRSDTPGAECPAPSMMRPSAAPAASAYPSRCELMGMLQPEMQQCETLRVSVVHWGSTFTAWAEKHDAPVDMCRGSGAKARLQHSRTCQSRRCWR